MFLYELRDENHYRVFPALGTGHYLTGEGGLLSWKKIWLRNCGFRESFLDKILRVPSVKKVCFEVS